MSNPLQPILEGLHAAGTHWQSLLGVLLTLVISQLLLYSLLKRIFGSELSGEEYFSLSLAGWLLPATLLSVFWAALGKLLSPPMALYVVAVIFLLALALSFRAPREAIHSSKPVLATLIAFVVLFIVLRLAFVAKAILPMYFDSAQHYLFVKNLLTYVSQPNAAWWLGNYYHLGFHFLAAFITNLTHAQINDVMLTLGQVILATMPFSCFFIVKHGTRSNSAATLALLLASFGWYMPAHAVDWGKYPALTSLALLPFALSMVYLCAENTNLPARKFLSLDVIAVLGVCVSIFLHSRSLIVFIIAALAWTLASLWQRMPKIVQLILFAALILAMIAEIRFIQSKGVLGPLFDPYGPKALFISLAVLLLVIFACLQYPRLAFFSAASILFLLISLFIPLGNLIPGFAMMTLLDRPFVEMILYLPLTLLGGFGLAALEQKLLDKNIAWKNKTFTFAHGAGIFFIALVCVNALFNYDLHPADCCDIASQDDLEAIRWMDWNLPAEARILVSSTELVVLPTEEYQGSAGGDAGTWINPLIGRTTLFMPFNTDFSQQQTLDTICQLQVQYIYVGKTGSAFDEAGMTVLPNAYQIFFALPGTRIYQVTGCSPQPGQ